MNDSSQPMSVVPSDTEPYIAKPFAPLVGFLELGESELTNKNQTILSEIWGWLGEETKSETISQRLYTLRQLENRLSPPHIGQTRLMKIYGYVQAQRAVAEAEKMRDSHLKKIEDE